MKYLLLGILKNLCSTKNSSEKYLSVQNKQNLKFANCSIFTIPVCKSFLYDTCIQANASNNQTHSVCGLVESK